MRCALLLGSVLVAVAAACHGPATPTSTLPMQSGQTAPDFAVPDDTGTVRRLSDWRGKTLVLWFYPKADTPG